MKLRAIALLAAFCMGATLFGQDAAQATAAPAGSSPPANIAKDDKPVAELQFSSKSDRSGAKTIDGTTQSGSVAVFAVAKNKAKIKSVSYYVDDPGLSHAPVRANASAPFDLMGRDANKKGCTTCSDSPAHMLDTSSLKDGDHTITAVITLDDGSRHVVQSRCTTHKPQPKCPAGNDAVRNVTYAITHKGKTATTSRLSGAVQSGDHIKVNFDIAAGCTNTQVSLASYESTTNSINGSQIL